jgi:UDP-N-acetylglucosamine/UDP-N-acetylgalactosamine diphosphorylase
MGPPASERLQTLERRGIILRAPATLDIGPEVSPDSIAPGVIVHAGCRIAGDQTSIGPGCEIGREQPMTLINCQLGHGVSLAGGYAEEATFLDGAACGSAVQVRPGTLLEEQAGAAHAVGLKQTVLFPFVTLGSQINFCDCLMAGGTSRRCHSEVGSSFIHFNFTPHGDKATPSLFGDVPRGVMLDQAPIFLGGQGGVVGPSRVEYGCVLAAGAILRDDALDPNYLLGPAPVGRVMARPFIRGAYRTVRRVVRNNLIYLGNIHALQQVYLHPRKVGMESDKYRIACRQGALKRLEHIRRERISRLDQLASVMATSIALQARPKDEGDRVAIQQQDFFQAQWPAWKTMLESEGAFREDAAARDRFLVGLSWVRDSSGWVTTVQALDSESRQAGIRWLQSIVDSIGALWHG